jgi:hypothetical protein
MQTMFPWFPREVHAKIANANRLATSSGFHIRTERRQMASIKQKVERKLLAFLFHSYTIEVSIT